jgi:hypothetical protein
MREETTRYTFCTGMGREKPDIKISKLYAKGVILE